MQSKLGLALAAHGMYSLRCTFPGGSSDDFVLLSEGLRLHCWPCRIVVAGIFTGKSHTILLI
jgi:hypothetical protein